MAICAFNISSLEKIYGEIQKGGDYTMRKLIVVLTIVLTLLCSTVFASAAEDPNVVLVNPATNSIIYSNSLLISVKITEPKTIRVSVYEEKQIVNGTYSAVNINTLTTSNGSIKNENLTPVVKMDPTEFNSKNNLSFYTKQIKVTPGLYLIKIETMEGGKVAYTNNRYVVVKEKTEEAEAKVFETQQSGTMQFLQNLLKTIFGD